MAAVYPAIASPGMYLMSRSANPLPLHPHGVMAGPAPHARDLVSAQKARAVRWLPPGLFAHVRVSTPMCAPQRRPWYGSERTALSTNRIPASA